MSGVSAAAAGEARDVRHRPGGPVDPAGAVAAAVERLDRLRDDLLGRLDQVEALAAAQNQQLTMTPSEREQALRGQVATLEAALARLQAELRRKEQDWQQTLRTIEDDRRQITEAWDRLEREQTAATANPLANAPSHALPGARGIAAAGVPPMTEATPAAAYKAHAPDPGDDRVTRDILRQFQTLQGDVRRNAGNAGPPVR